MHLHVQYQCVHPPPIYIYIECLPPTLITTFPGIALYICFEKMKNCAGGILENTSILTITIYIHCAICDNKYIIK